MSLDKFYEPSKLPLGKVRLVRADNEFWREQSGRIIETYHSYVPLRFYVGRRIDYIVWNDVDGHSDVIGSVGIGSAAFGLGDRDHWIGWGDKAKIARLVMVANNYRYTLMPNAPHNVGSVVLGKLEQIAIEDWWNFYGDKLVLLETMVEGHEGTVYKAANWTLVGKTAGCKLKMIDEDKLPEYQADGWGLLAKTFDQKSGKRMIKIMKDLHAPKLIFVRPLNKAYKKYLLGVLPPPHKKDPIVKETVSPYQSFEMEKEVEI